MSWLALMAATALTAAPGGAPGFLDGEFLHDLCRVDPAAEDAALRKGLCLGYILGAADQALIAEADLPPAARTICLPSTVLAEHLRAAVEEVLEHHPRSRGAAAGSVVTAALAAHFPCS